jgi:hypothetical protein
MNIHRRRIGVNVEGASACTIGRQCKRGQRADDDKDYRDARHVTLSTLRLRALTSGYRASADATERGAIHI